MVLTSPIDIEEKLKSLDSNQIAKIGQLFMLLQQNAALVNLKEQNLNINIPQIEELKKQIEKLKVNRKL